MGDHGPGQWFEPLRASLVEGPSQRASSHCTSWVYILPLCSRRALFRFATSGREARTAETDRLRGGRIRGWDPLPPQRLSQAPPQLGYPGWAGDAGAGFMRTWGEAGVCCLDPKRDVTLAGVGTQGEDRGKEPGDRSHLGGAVSATPSPPLVA